MATDTPPAPVVEIGYQVAATTTYQMLLDELETTPELQFPLSVRVFDSMRRSDGQCKSVLNAVTLPVLRTPWRIDPNGAREEVVRLVADDLGLPIVGRNDVLAPVRLKDRFDWKSHIRLALLMLPFGFSYFEQVYRVEDDGSLAHLRKLAYRPPQTIEMVDVASDGGLVAIKQYWTQQNSSPRPIPVDRLVAYVYEREGGNWLGTSVFRPVYKNWLLKDRLLRVQVETVERNGMGIPVYEAAETEQDLSAGKAMATSLRSGKAAGAATPHGAKLRLMGVEGTLPNAEPVVRYHDEQIARAVLAHFLNLGQQTGSWALGSTFADFFTLSLQTLAQQVADTATQHIVEDLVDVNWGPDEPAPRLVFDEIGSRQPATAEAMKTLVDAGILHPDEVLETATRQFYGLPPADPATATAPAGEADPNAAVAPEDAAFGAESVAAKYDPSQPRDPHSGKWSDGGVSALVKSLKKVGGVGAWSMRGDDDAYMDWSTRNSDGTFKLEAVGEDDVVVRMDLTVDQIAALHEALTDSIASRNAGAAGGGGYIPTDEVDGPYLDWSTLHFDDDGRHSDGWLEIGNGQDAVTFDASEKDLSDWHTALTIWLLVQAGGDEVKAARLLASLDRAGRRPKSAGVDLNDEASWIAAAAGVDTHPGGEQLKHYWLYGEGAAKWATWTDLYEHLRKYIKRTKLLKATVSKWYRLRYGHNPPRHHVAAARRSVRANFDPSQPRDSHGRWARFRDITDAVKDALSDDFGPVLEIDSWHTGDLGDPDSVVRGWTSLHDDGTMVLSYASPDGKPVPLLDSSQAKPAFWPDLADHLRGAAGDMRHGEASFDSMGPEDDPWWSVDVSDGGELSLETVNGDGIGAEDPDQVEALADRIDELVRWHGDWDNGEYDEDEESELVAAARRVLADASFEGKHKRGRGGRFVKMIDMLAEALADHRKSGGEGDPFARFDRAQLRRAAVSQGIQLGRGESRDSIADKLSAHLLGAQAKRSRIAELERERDNLAAQGGGFSRSEGVRNRYSEISSEIERLRFSGGTPQSGSVTRGPARDEPRKPGRRTPKPKSEDGLTAAERERARRDLVEEWNLDQQSASSLDPDFKSGRAPKFSDEQIRERADRLRRDAAERRPDVAELRREAEARYGKDVYAWPKDVLAQVRDLEREQFMRGAQAIYEGMRDPAERDRFAAETASVFQMLESGRRTSDALTAAIEQRRADDERAARDPEFADWLREHKIRGLALLGGSDLGPERPRPPEKLGAPAIAPVPSRPGVIEGDIVAPPNAGPGARAQRMADRQGKAGRDAAGIGRTPQADAAADRRRQREIGVQLALVQADIDRADESGLMGKRERDRLEDEKDALQQEFDEIDARLHAKRKRK